MGTNMVEVVATDTFAEWYEDLDEGDADAVTRVVGLLESLGVTLGAPYSSQIKGSKVAMRELRVQSRGHPLRVLYVFDPKRQAVLLVGGDKTGDDRFYEVEVPRAEKVYEKHLADEAAKDRPKQGTRKK